MPEITLTETTNSSRGSLALSVLKHAHKRAVFHRRVRVLAASLGGKIPPGSTALDIGCGDGTIATLIKKHDPTLTIQGIEIAPRPNCQIACTPFDGIHIPHETGSFDVCFFADVLHHAKNIPALLAEATRVSRRYVLIKDHLSESWLDFKTLQVMDWVGNRPHGVVLPYGYRSRSEWDGFFSEAGLALRDFTERIPIYPFPFSAVFGRRLHFVALLEKTKK